MTHFDFERNDSSRSSKIKLKAIAVIVAAVALSPLCVAAEAEPPSKTEQAGERKGNWAKVDRLVTDELQRVVDKQRRIEGQSRDVRVIAKIDPERKAIAILLDGGYVPKYNGGDFEDLQSELMTTAIEVARPAISIENVEFRFDNRPIFFYFPEDAPPPRLQKKKLTRLADPLPIVSVAGGHGLYFHYGFNDWRAQRDPSNGMVEDFVTPYYQRDLAEKLVDEGWSTVAKARTNESTLHQPSGQPWWKVSARYWLEKTYPQEPGIWHSLPNSTDNSRERNEDIRSRPLFANFVGADAAINIHTNGDENSSDTRGTKVFYYPGRSVDQQLASNVLCYMKEAVHSVGNYNTWKFDNNPTAVSNKGEITLAQVPAIIVELGFHTNAEDALAMQDDIFRGRAVNGMAKGWYLHSKGIGCEPLKITSIPPIQVTQNIPISWSVGFEGHPKFPVTVTTAFKTCPSGWNCAQQTNRIYSETESPLNMTWRCNVTGTVAATTFQVESVITDDDGVRSSPQGHTVTCSPPSGTRLAQSTLDSSAPIVEVSHSSL